MNNVWRYILFEVEGAETELESGYEREPSELGLKEWDLLFNYTTVIGIDNETTQEIYIQVADEMQACLLYKGMNRLEKDVDYLSSIIMTSTHSLITVVKNDEGKLVFQQTEQYYHRDLNMVDGKLELGL